MDRASFCRGVVFRGVPGINNVLIGAVPALCENAPTVPARATAHSPLPHPNQPHVSQHTLPAHPMPLQEAAQRVGIEEDEGLSRKRLYKAMARDQEALRVHKMKLEDHARLAKAGHLLRQQQQVLQDLQVLERAELSRELLQDREGLEKGLLKEHLQTLEGLKSTEALQRKVLPPLQPLAALSCLPLALARQVQGTRTAQWAKPFVVPCTHGFCPPPPLPLPQGICSHSLNPLWEPHVAAVMVVRGIFARGQSWGDQEVHTKPQKVFGFP